MNKDDAPLNSSKFTRRLFKLASKGFGKPRSPQSMIKSGLFMNLKINF